MDKKLLLYLLELASVVKKTDINEYIIAQLYLFFHSDGLFGNVLVTFFTEHIKEGQEEYPAKSLNTHQTNFKWLQVYPKGHFISSGYNSLLQIFKNTKSEIN